MSGYFQRLAQSVMQPTERVHPMVGSFFAPTSRELEPEPSLELTRNPSTLQDAEPEQHARETIEEQREENHSLAAPVVRPLIAPENAESKAGERRAAESRLEPSTRVIREERKVTSQAEAQSVATANAFRPLVPVVAKALPAPAALHPPLLPQAIRKADKASIQAEHRGEDDIQIHIGRVEVLAVPPTPVTVAPKAPRKSATSLDDYLRRRDRRPL